MKIVFLSLLYDRDREEEYQKIIKSMLSNCSNTFQYALLDGFYENNILDNVFLINALPVGVYKKDIDKLFFQESDFYYEGKVIGKNIPYINYHIIKQYTRRKNAYKELKRFIKDNPNKEIKVILYNVYKPFLKAAIKALKKFKNVEVCPIITDMPGEYGMLPKIWWKRKYLLYSGKQILKYLKNVNKFVFLTEQMKNPLQVSDDKFIIMEGIYSNIDKNNNNYDIIPHNKKVVLYTGSLNINYGILTLIEAFKLIKKDDIELWICGGSGHEKQVKQIAENDNRIRFFGSVSREVAIKMQRSADLLVNPRPNKGEFVKYSFPSKTMEYLSSAKPTLMYKLAGIPSEYDDYLNYVEGEEIIDMANDMEKILYQNYDFYLEKAKCGREFLLNNKNAKVQTKRILQFLEK